MKKAQIRMTETIAVLFIFFVLILFGIIFYAQYSVVAAKQKQNQVFAQNAIEITTKALFLPELLCGKGDAEPEDFCLDVLKLKHVNQILDDNIGKYYFDIFGYGNISVQEIYPSDKSYQIYYKEKSADSVKAPSKESFFVVSLRDETAGELSKTAYGIGLMKVEVFR